MRVLLISTYELGRQPFGLASPAAWLRARGHEVHCQDLSLASLDEALVKAAELVAFYVPMHTATRLATRLIEPVRRINPRAHLCFYGLYAPMNEEYLRGLSVGTILGGEFEGGLARLADRLSVNASGNQGPGATLQEEPVISLEPLKFLVPDREGLARLEKYAHLVMPGHGHRVVGSTEASRGCKHLCRHCPVVPVYRGVFRIVSRDVVLEDIRRQVAAGAQHISFGDADFFNGIRHAVEIVTAVHGEFPRLTYDVTIKIEHLRKHEKHLPLLQDTGCLFVTSAVESFDDAVLKRLDKGHTREDFLYVAGKFRELGMVLHPTFVPFTPWTTIESYVDLLRVLREERLVGNVPPVQLGIRLLIPAGSRLLELEEVQRMVGRFDKGALFFPWAHCDARMDALSEEVQRIAAVSEKKKLSRHAAFAQIWKAAHAAGCLTGRQAGRGATAEQRTPDPATISEETVPFMSEPWYCCAEPTRDQFVSIGALKATSPESAVSRAEGFV
jgi:radical SAM superfamily enzyme YgiQ (UPF0313 family)